MYTAGVILMAGSGERERKDRMKKIGFDNDKYLKMQSEHIRERISKFDNKLYLEFGGKLFDDYHASRVLPGFEPDSKLRMLMQLFLFRSTFRRCIY